MIIIIKNLVKNYVCVKFFYLFLNIINSNTFTNKFKSILTNLYNTNEPTKYKQEK
jgi:hypothetical protein